MKWNRKRKALAVIAGTYSVLWILTATWGISDVDKAFDREFAIGVPGFAENRMPPVAIQRIQTMANVRDLMDPKNQLPDGFFRYRTYGVAVAPFVIVDEAAMT